jgi:competence protein ComGC
MKKTIQITNPKNAALSLIELLLVIILISGALFAYISNQRDQDKEQARNRFAEQVVTVIKAVDQKIHVDGYLLKKPTNYKDDVAGRKGTQYEPSFWDNPGSTLLASAKTSGSKKIVFFDTQVPVTLNKLLVSRGNVICGAADGWVPMPTKEIKTALIPCDLWVNKMPYNLIPKLYVKYQETPITPITESRTPSNEVVNRYVNDVFLTFQFTNANSAKGNYANISDMVKRMNTLNRNQGATGTMNFYFGTLNHTGGDTDALGLDVAITPLECFRSPTTCLIVGRWSAKGGEENLRIDGMNSMINSSISFKMGDSQSDNKAMCNRFVKTTDENNNESVPGDVDTGVPADEAPKSKWIFQENIPCGIGIATTSPTSGHAVASDQTYAVNSLSGSSNFKNLTLDRKCNNFELDANNLIYNTNAQTPCGIIHSPNGGTDQIIMLANEIQAKEGIFGNAANGSGIGKGLIHSRTLMIQENAILKDVGVQGNFNAQKNLHVIGSGKTAFSFTANWQNELNAMLAYCSTVASGKGTTDNAVVAACNTLNSGTLSVTANTVIKGNLQIDGVLYQGAQDITQEVNLNGDVKMGSPNNKDLYVDSAGNEINTLCVGHDLLQGDESCEPNSALNPNGGDFNVMASADANNPNWLAVGGAGGPQSANPDRYQTAKVTFEVKGTNTGYSSANNKGSLIRKDANSTWNGTTPSAGIGNAATTPDQVSSLKVQNNNNNTGAYVKPEAFDMTKNGDITRTETYGNPSYDPTKPLTTTNQPFVNQVYSFWSKTLFPTATGIVKGASCTNFQVGSIARDINTGAMYTCVRNGTGTAKQWIASLSNTEVKQSSNTLLGDWDLCTLTTLGALKNSGKCELTYSANDPANPNTRTWRLSNRGRCQATCIGKVNDNATPDNWNFVYTTCGYYNTPDRLPLSSDDPNATDAQLGFIGGTGTASPTGNPPVSNAAYGYKVGQTYSCGAWTPAANTVNAGTVFTQSRTCQQDYQQSCYIYEQNQYGDVRVKNVGTGAFANSTAAGNSNYFASPVTETQTALGTRPFLQ